ncbi:MAG: hypothetical protein ACXAC5_12970 [Promethearchaeota archaeon]|jgi:hypothetical protein
MKEKRDKINPDQAQNLVFFKNKEARESKEFPKYSFEAFDQEDKIKLLHEFKPYGGHYLLSIQLINQSMAPITKVKIKIGYSNFLTLTRSYPPTIYIPEPIEERETSKIILEFDELNERSTKQINLHFTPHLLGREGEIRTIFTYVNNKDFIRVLNSDPINIMLDKVTINPKIIPSSYIREFSQIPHMKRAIKSLGIGTLGNYDPNLYFTLLEQVFLRNSLQLIANDPEKRILWYFGSDLESRDDLLIIGQIASNKVEIIGISKNHHVLISFLTSFSFEFKEHLLSKGIANNLDDIHDLECKYCGANLPYFPEKGEEIQCTKCKYEQSVW